MGILQLRSLPNRRPATPQPFDIRGEPSLSKTERCQSLGQFAPHEQTRMRSGVVGPFLLTALLRGRLEAAHGRVITLTGIYQRKGHVDTSDLEFARRRYHWLSANNQAQKARWLFVSELARRAPTLMTAAVHPGAVLTGTQARLPRFGRALIYSLARPVFVRPEVGAIPVLRLAAHPHPGRVTGRFFDRCHLAPDVADAALAQEFWATCDFCTRCPLPGLRSRCSNCKVADIISEREACSFIRLRSRGIQASYGEMSRRSGEAA